MSKSKREINEISHHDNNKENNVLIDNMVGKENTALLLGHTTWAVCALAWTLKGGSSA